MRRIGIIAVLSLIVTALAAAPALAQTVGPTSVTQTGGLHFCQDVANNPTVTVHKTIDPATGFVTSAFLTSTGTVCGAGTQADATLTATAIVTTGCVNRGGNEPRGLQRSFQTVTGSETFETRQGRGTFNVTTSGVTAAERECPSPNMDPVLVSVLFTDITLTVTSQTGTVTATFPDLDP